MSFLDWLARESRAVLIHQLSKMQTQKMPFKLHGLPVSTAFHPTRSIIFIATKKNIRVYDLLKQRLVKKLETRVKEVSSIAIHPGGERMLTCIFYNLFLYYGCNCPLLMLFPLYLQVTMLLWVAKMESYVGLTWIYHLSLIEFSSMRFSFILMFRKFLQSS